MKKIYNITKIIILIISLFVSLYIGLFVENDAYNFMFLLPLTYGFCFVIYLAKYLFKKMTLFRIVFNVVAFLRYVISPSFMVLANYYKLVSVYKPTNEQIELAILLMCYEIIIYTITFFIIDKCKKNRETKQLKRAKDVEIKGKFIYILFIIFSIGLLIMNPTVLNKFTFITPVEESFNLVDSNEAILVEITVICLIVAKGLIFILIMNAFKEKYKRTNKNKYVILALITVFINSVYYYGKNRSQFVFLAIASGMVFIYLFPKYKKTLLITVCTIIVVILPIMTRARNYYDFYSNETGLRRFFISKQSTINEYFGGVNNVAIGLETANEYSQNRELLNLVYDFIRPVVGVNLLVKNIKMDYSNLYFNYCYFQDEFVSVIFPTITQGYFYFGFFLAPILGICLICIATFLEIKIQNTCKIEYIFFFTSSLLRLGTLMGANINIQLNDLSIQIMLPVIIIVLNSKFVYKKGAKSE